MFSTNDDARTGKGGRLGPQEEKSIECDPESTQNVTRREKYMTKQNRPGTTLTLDETEQKKRLPVLYILLYYCCCGGTTAA